MNQAPAEQMDLMVYTDGFGNAAPQRLVTLYAVTDDTPSGFCLLVSVVHCLPEVDPTRAELRQFLDQLGFQTNSLMFGDRPPGIHRFQAYWSDLLAPSADTRFDNR